MKPVNSNRTRRQLIAVAALVSLLAAGTFTSTATPENEKEKASSVIRVAPPAPVFDQTARLSELASRRQRVAEKVGQNGILVLFSTEPRVYANDVDYHYRQENNLFYLTNLNQKGATLVLMPGNPQLREVLFLPRRDPAAETWTGHMYSPEEAQQLSGIREIWQASEFDPFIKALRNRQPYRPKPENIFMSELPRDLPLTNDHGYTALFDAAAKGEAGVFMLVPGQGESREYKPEQRFAADWSSTASGYSIKNAWPIFTQMRLVKSPME